VRRAGFLEGARSLPDETVHVRTPSSVPWRAEVRQRRPSMAALVIAILLALSVARAAAAPLVDAGPPFGKLPLVDQVVCAASGDPDHRFVEVPAGASCVETILGRQCRTLPNVGGPSYFAFRLGMGRGLRVGATYLLTVEFPEDAPRSMFILNRGAEMARGFATGSAIGDLLYSYTNNNAESLRYPLSGRYRAWRMLFALHDRFPDLNQPRGEGVRPMLPSDGFWVVIARGQAASDPLSKGPAVFRIRLFAVPSPSSLYLSLRLPSPELPRRHIFWREEMSDGVIEGRTPEQRGVVDETTWFEAKARLARFLGMDTFAKDLLEFGHNQGWDCGDNDDWYNRSRTPRRWEAILAILNRYHLNALPYYEYAGATGRNGIGTERRCLPLSGAKAYTHISWSEILNADVTDPDTLADAERLLDATIIRYKGRASFLGAWFRTRPSHLPVSFSDATIARFQRESGEAAPVTRARLQAEPGLLQRYYKWWFERRRQFLSSLAAYLRSRLGPRAFLLFTADPSEPGPSLPADGLAVVTDDEAAWRRIASQPQPGNRRLAVLPFRRAVDEDAYLRALTSPIPTWGQWEWQHSSPQPDPERYRASDAVMLTYSFNRLYTVSSRRALDAFRTRAGLAVVRHYPLNEDGMDPSLGYFVSDIERAGPFCMAAEAMAVANGDPWYIGYLSSSSFNRGFPEYVRAFNAAFMALPALPSRVLANASSDPRVVVRVIPTKGHGTYLAVVNASFGTRAGVIVRLPVDGTVTNAATGAKARVRRGRLRLTLYPFQLQAYHISPKGRPS